MSEARAYTEEEFREKFIRQIRHMAKYWADPTVAEEYSTEERIMGFAHSFLVMFDGGSMGFPAMDISLAPHPNDKQYCIDNEENYWEPGMMVNDCQLHELLYSKEIK